MPVSFLDKKGQVFETPIAGAPLADSHGHLTHFRHTTASEAIVRAAHAGVRLLVVPVDPVDELGPGKRFADASSFLTWLDDTLAEASAHMANEESIDVRIVAGAHPYGAPELDEAALTRLDELLASPRAVGVGEFGFDYGPWSKVSTANQERAFRIHLEIAHERNLPIELHLRNSDQGEPEAHIRAAAILREMGVPEAGCDLHCFTYGPQIMEPFVEMGCHIAFGGAVSFARSEDIRAAAIECPAELILSETDSPYMAPVPLRGCECEPGMLAFTAAMLARIREEAGIASYQQTYDNLWANACSFFGL